MDELSPAITLSLSRLAEHGFSLLPLPDVSTHYAVARDGLVALVERRANGEFGSTGNPGKLTEKGLALFVRREGKAVFVAKGLTLDASAEETETAPRFAADLRQALGT